MVSSRIMSTSTVILARNLSMPRSRGAFLNREEARTATSSLLTHQYITLSTSIQYSSHLEATRESPLSKHPNHRSLKKTEAETRSAMEPGVAAVAYTAETAVEGAAGAAVAIARSTMPIKAEWSPVSLNIDLPRSSHSITVVKGRAYIFGGEIKPREPVGNDMEIVTLPSGTAEADYKCVAPRGDEVPPPRVGHTAVSISDNIYVFGGRGGPNMTALEEKGRVWVYDTMSNSWSFLDPVDGSPFPEARSYHASTATEHPLPNTVGTGASIIESHGTIFIHGGCLAKGRSAEVWSFDVAAKFWSKLPDAPGPARGGPSMVISRDRLYRFGGFDGNDELGGQIDYLELSKETFDDKGGKGELAVVLKSGKWNTVSMDASPQFPGNRSVAGLHPITTGQGRNYLILVLGEKSPSANGHEEAGNFWDDIWSYQLRPEGSTAASIKDAFRDLVGAKTAEGTFAKVDISEASMTEGPHIPGPGPRGWFGSAGCDTDNGTLIVWGGINQANKRLGDGWLLNFNL